MKLYLLIFVAGLLLLFCSPAWAAIYKVEIHQIGQQRPGFITLCNDHEVCFLTLSLPTQNNNEDTNGSYIDVTLKINSQAAYFQFMYNDQYLAVTSIGEEILEIPLYEQSARHLVRLYSQHPASKGDQQNSLRSSPVLRVSKNILTELEVLVQPVPE